MLLEQERKKIVSFGQKLVTSGLTAGTGGNLSVFNRRERLIAITPSGMDYYETRPQDIVVVTAAGEIRDGAKRPSSELMLHLAVYRQRTDIRAVVHTHSVYATTLAVLGWELPAVHYLVGFSGKKVPLAPYATFGSTELARSVTETLGEYNAVLMANHGILTVGPNIAAAFTTAEVIEYVARVYCQAISIGNPVVLTDEAMAMALEKFNDYGQKKLK